MFGGLKPMTKFFFKDGEKKDQIIGLTGKDQIVAKLEALA